ncbi:hypothetical protein EYC80_004328 [Monilinia laxa]|uniref:Uncharacterized protein n=1 Tax=Monilinia laxa TaxID=61186 RepID=A0A5N6KMI4_MONLA|nr:hypothetical protein EYC80_004328 [Monilinia laxa]
MCIVNPSARVRIIHLQAKHKCKARANTTLKKFLIGNFLRLGLNFISIRWNPRITVIKQPNYQSAVLYNIDLLLLSTFLFGGEGLG